MPWIQNISFADVSKGQHIAISPKSMLIQIVDPDMAFPTPKYQFTEVHQFKFLDIEEQDEGDEFKITNTQAQQLVNLLQHALDNSMTVIVHCVVGICRSGAVCEVGVMMGFDDTETFRNPNLLVKHKMMKVLGWTYD